MWEIKESEKNKPEFLKIFAGFRGKIASHRLGGVTFIPGATDEKV